MYLPLGALLIPCIMCGTGLHDRLLLGARAGSDRADGGFSRPVRRGGGHRRTGSGFGMLTRWLGSTEVCEYSLLLLWL